MIGKWILPLPFIFANKNYTLTTSFTEKSYKIDGNIQCKQSEK